MNNRNLEGWRTHKPLNKQILSPFQSQWVILVLNAICGSWGMLVTHETTSSVLSWYIQCFSTLIAPTYLLLDASGKSFRWQIPLASRNHLGCVWSGQDQALTCLWWWWWRSSHPIFIPSSTEKLWPQKIIFAFKYFQAFLRPNEASS